MKISSPPGLRYPFTIQALQKRKDEKVARSEKLFTYWYEEIVTETDRWGADSKVKKRWPQQFDATTGGKITRWFIKPGTVIERAGYVTRTCAPPGGIADTHAELISSKSKSHAPTGCSSAASASTAART